MKLKYDKCQKREIIYVSGIESVFSNKKRHLIQNYIAIKYSLLL